MLQASRIGLPYSSTSTTRFPVCRCARPAFARTVRRRRAVGGGHPRLASMSASCSVKRAGHHARSLVSCRCRSSAAPRVACGPVPSVVSGQAAEQLLDSLEQFLEGVDFMTGRSRPEAGRDRQGGRRPPQRGSVSNILISRDEESISTQTCR